METFSRVIASVMAISLAFFVVHATPAAKAGDSDDLVKAAVGLAAIGIIANEVKRGKQKRKAAEAAAAATAAEKKKRSSVPRNCRYGRWDGQNWRDSDGRICRPTPAVCLRETRRGNRNIVTFDSECMMKEGFRLSRRY